MRREQADDHRDHCDRRVDEEDRAPAHVLCEEAADHRSDRKRQCADSGPSANRGTTLMRRERLGDDRQASRHHAGRADALDRPECDQDLVIRGEADDQTGEAKDDHAEQEHPPAAEDVAQSATGDQHHRERQGVGVDRPLER